MSNPAAVVEKFWRDMESNDFIRAAENLAEEYICEWPQSNERIRGKANFITINTRYPAEGRWKFTVNTLLRDGDRVVTDVSVTDGSVTARAVTFHTVVDGLIRKQTEYWPEEYEAPAWRKEWTEPLSG